LITDFVTALPSPLELAVNQTILIRENFGDTALGTCRETIEGGEHYRVWRQNGTAVRFDLLLYPFEDRFDTEDAAHVGQYWSLVLGCFFRDGFTKQPYDYS